MTVVHVTSLWPGNEKVATAFPGAFPVLRKTPCARQGPDDGQRQSVEITVIRAVGTGVGAGDTAVGVAMF